MKSFTRREMPSCVRNLLRNVGVATLLSITAIAQQESGDPTTINPEMEEVIRALRAAEEKSSSGKGNVEVEPIELLGLVEGNGEAAGASGVAVFRSEDRFHLKREGETLDHFGTTYLVMAVSDTLIELKNAEGGPDLVLRSKPDVPKQNHWGSVLAYEMVGVPLYLAAKALSMETGIQIAVSTEARDIPVSISLQLVDGPDVLDAIALTHGLYKAKVTGTEIIRLHTGEEYSRDANSFLTERTQVYTLKHPNARDVALAIRDLFGDRVRLSDLLDNQEDPGEFLTEDLQQRFERFDVIDARGQGFGIDSRGGAGVGVLPSLSSSLRSNNRSNFNNSRFNLSRNGDDNRSFVDRIEFGDDLTAQEIAALESGSAEALERIVQSRADIFVTVVDRLNKVVVRTRDEKAMAEIDNLVRSLDVPTPLVLLEVKILEVDLERGLDTAFDWSFQSGNWNGGFLPPGPATSGDLVFNFLSDSFQAQIRLLQQTNKLTMLSKPILLTANNEVSRLFVGEEVPLNRTFGGGQTIVADGSPIVTPSSTDIEFRPVGSTLLITPNINHDKTVSLRILQEESRIVEDGANVLVPDADGGFNDQTIDTVSSQTASGTFVAQDHQTIAVGGMITERLGSRRSQIPLLGDIPVMGVLFRNQSLQRERKEIVLLITPHIIQTPREGESISRKLVENNSYHPSAPFGDDPINAFTDPEVLLREDIELRPLNEFGANQSAPKQNPPKQSSKGGAATETRKERQKFSIRGPKVGGKR